jgi:2-dehydropantoate 2-reductase
MKICVYGAGAIGGFVAAKLALVEGLDVSVVARGQHLDAIRSRGLRIVTPTGETAVHVTATDKPAELGTQDYVFIALKQHQLTGALDGIAQLLGKNTAVLPPTTGIPYWYFHKLPGVFEGKRIDRLDPAGAQWNRLGPERVLGCVYWIAAEVTDPGVVRHDGKLMRFPIGEPDGTSSPRVTRFAEAMNAAGLNAQIVPDIRGWIWAKMISSLSWNPIATLTLATQAELTGNAKVVELVKRMMNEADALAGEFGVSKMPISIDDRIASARSIGHHKMSMLQDLERGRPLEIDVLLDSIEAMKELSGGLTPTIDDVYALLRLRCSKISPKS